MQHGERRKRLKQNTMLHNNVSNKLNDKHKEQLNDK
jgi:histone H3/H4